MMGSSRIIAGAVLVVLGIGWLLQAAGVVHFDSNIVAPLALIGIGIVLVAGAPNGLFVPFLVAGIILAAVLASDSGHHERVTPTVRTSSAQRPASAADIHPYNLGVGNLVIDLTLLPRNGGTYHVSAHVGTGRIDVIVPAGTSVSVDAHSGVGSLDIFGERFTGAGTNDNTSVTYDNRTGFDLKLRVGVGSIRVVHRAVAMST